MVRETFIASLLCLVLSAGCASTNAALNKDENGFKPSPRNNEIPAYRVLVEVRDVDDGVLVAGLPEDSPARAAGMRMGDLIVSVNGMAMKTKDLAKLVHRNAGELISFVVKRNNELITYPVKPRFVYTELPTFHKTRELVEIDKRTVNAAVIVGEVKNNLVQEAATWEASERQTWQAAIEGRMLEIFGGTGRFNLVDRTRIDAILEEQKMSLTGLISDDTRARIGKMTGATHLYLVSLARYPNPQDRNKCVDVITARMIEIESGSVLAADRKEWDCH